MTIHHHRAGRSALLGLLLALTLLIVSACGSGDSTTGSSDSDDAGLARAEAAVAQARTATDDFVSPAPVPGVDALKGSTVMYVPIVATVPYFETFGNALESTLDRAGLKFQECDAKANPSDASACLDQAVRKKVTAVVMDQVPPALAQQAIAGLEKAGIPLVLLGEPLPKDAGPLVRSITADQAETLALAANSIIADASSTPHVLLVRIIDSPVSIAQMDGATKAFAANCPDCVVSEVETKTADLQNLPTVVSAALLKDPAISYLLPQFDVDVQAALQGARQTNRTVRAASTVAELGGLQRIAADQGQFADVGWDLVRESWLATDLVLRLVTGTDVAETAYTVPLRVFDETNIDDLTLTAQDWENGTWYGDPGYQSAFTQAWNVD
jgi:ribose transport system substrate-binding protein